MFLAKSAVVGFCLVVFATGAVGQITGSGTANQVPKFTGATSVGNSAITELSGSVGIGTTSPVAPLDVSAYLHVGGNSSATTTAQGAYIGWNANGIGETDLFNNQGGGFGGFAFFNTPPSGSPKTALMVISGAGNATINGQIASSISNANIGGTISILNPAKTTSGTASVWNIYNMSGSYGNSLQFWDYDNIGCNTGGMCAPRLSLADNGNVGVGTMFPSQKLEVDGNIRLTAGSGASITFADNTTQTTAWTGSLCGGDYAESVDVSGARTAYEPGDVLVIDPARPGYFLKSAEPYSTFVTGIYSTKPGLVGRRQTTDRNSSKSEVPMAMMGIVPTKVSAENGPIRPGDLLVTSSTPGYAMKGTDRNRMLGTMIGKALGSLASGKGVIEVVVGLQ